MKTKDNKFFPWSVRILFFIEIIIILSAVCFIVSVGSSINRNIELNKKRELAYQYFEDIDSLRSNGHGLLTKDWMIDELWKNQKYMYSKQDNLLADVRQETNNSIEKITSELNFWIAILAFLGVLVPIAITYTGEKEAKNWLEKKEKVYDEHIHIANERSCLKIKELNDLKNQLLSEMDKNKEEVRKSLLDLRLQMDVNILSSIHNNRFLETQNELRTAYNEIVKETIAEFMMILNSKIDSYKSSNTKEESDAIKLDLLRMSMQFYDVIHNLTLNYSGSTRPRFLYEAEKSIQSLIKVLLSPLPDKNRIGTALQNIESNINYVLTQL